MYVEHLEDSIEELLDILGVVDKSALQPVQEDYIFDLLEEYDI